MKSSHKCGAAEAALILHDYRAGVSRVKLQHKYKRHRETINEILAPEFERLRDLFDDVPYEELIEEYGSIIAICEFYECTFADVVNYKNLQLPQRETGTPQLCWTCKRACGGCSWSAGFEPVAGWVAVPYNFEIAKGVYIDSYEITGCPQYGEG